MPRTHLRRGIAMIELIFAIVIMGIVLMSAPMLISQAATSSSIGTQQEGIAEAASRAHMILTYPWDEANTIAGRSPVVLRAAGGNVGLNENPAGSNLRLGTPASSYRSFMDASGNNNIQATPIGNVGEVGALNDIDDFNGVAVNLQLIGANAGANDYIEKGGSIVMNSNVWYMNDAPFVGNTYANLQGGILLRYQPNFNNAINGTPANPPTNIKRVQVTLTRAAGAAAVAELNKNITLHAFSCNIGTQKLEERP